MSLIAKNEILLFTKLMKKTFLLLFALAAFCAYASAQKKYVGGDISSFLPMRNTE